MPSESSFTSRLLERANVIAGMKARGLSLEWRHEFALADLSACCGRMSEALSGIAVADKDAQRALIENPNFAAYYARLLVLLPEEPEKQPEPAHTYSSSRNPYPRSSAPLSRRAVLLGRFYELLPICREAGRDITACPAADVVDVLGLDGLDSRKWLTLLENYTAEELSRDRQHIADGFRNCFDVPLELTAEQKDLIQEPCAATRHLFSSAPFETVWALMEATPGLMKIIRLFHRHGVEESLELKEYQGMAQDAGAFFSGLRSLLKQMGPDVLGRFVSFWQKGGCTLHELRSMERWASAHPNQDWDSLLANYSGYINLIYGKRFQRIELSKAASYQESVLIYAIVNRKNHFIRLVDELAKTFLGLPQACALFWEELYQEHFNLNDLSAKDLADCAGIYKGDFHSNALAPGRRYTFPELKALHKASAKAFALYHELSSDSTDYRLRVFRQVSKGDILSGVGDGEIGDLAAALDRKPLYEWLEQDFGHIAGLTAGDAARMLPHLDDLRHLLPGIRDRVDARLVLRHLERLGQYRGVGELKEDVLRIDGDWARLSGEMDLSPEFIEAHKDSILDFLCQNGAEIAVKYGDYLKGRQREAFFRVVKAELMGKLGELKYFEGDLQRELDFPLTQPVKSGWRRNLGIVRDGLKVREYDDFFSTMLLGVQPQRTCLSYIDGQYRECLLSAFDSNKKILYATLDGEIVGRAFLRLTKGRLTGSGTQVAGGFTFVDLENTAAPRNEAPGRREQVTLFLERPYISGVGPKAKDGIQRAFVELAVQKAEELDVTPVLSQDYRDSCGTGFAQTRYDIYISNSKAGKQYLDSLDGEATVSKEGSYKANTFLVRETGTLPLACNG